MNSPSRDHEPESARIAREIEQTREALDDTLDQLNDRLRPESLMADGAVWVANRLERIDPHKVQAVAARGREMFDREPIGWSVFTVGVFWLCARAFARNYRAEVRHERLMAAPLEAPMVEPDEDRSGITLSVCLAAAGVGLLAGLALPRTRGEDEVLGRASDEFIEKTPHMASRGTHAIEEAMLTHS